MFSHADDNYQEGIEIESLASYREKKNHID